MNTGHTPKARPSVWQRLWGRFRHGLLFQELLDRMATLGLLCMPYIVTVEELGAAPQPATPPGCSFRQLTPDDAEAIVAISIRRRQLEETRRQLSTLRCFGAFLGDQLIGHTWASLQHVPLINSGGTLFELEPTEAYLLDMFVDPAHRGLRVAPWLRAQVMGRLAAEGRTRFYSLSVVFNRSSRQFKARLGAIETEWRIGLQLLPHRLPGIDLRLRRRGQPLRTRFARRRGIPRARS